MPDSRWLVMLLLLSSIGKGGVSESVRFVDVTLQSGINFKHVNGASGQKYFLETMGSGCGFLDYDGDGYLDIYLVNGTALPGFSPQGPATSILYRNQRDGTFADVTRKAGVGAEGLYGMGVAAADYDNDGDTDLYVTGYLRSVLFRNNGNGSFTDVTSAAKVTNTDRWGASAAFFDYDNDGFLDLYVTNYVNFSLSNNVPCGDRNRGIRSYCDPSHFNGVPDVLYRNNRDGTFTDVSERAGVNRPEGKGLGVVAADIDGDGRLDLYVANDMVANFLYRNRGDGTFEDIAPMSGTAYSSDGKTQASMGVDVCDYDADGQPDILVTNFSREVAALYHNDGRALFSEVAFQAGVGESSFLLTGWGTRFFDFDNDGDEDVFLVNGHTQDDVALYNDFVPYPQPKLLFENVGGRFVDVSKRHGEAIERPSVGRGAAFGDLDNDGDVDILITNCNQSATLLRNDGGNRNRWITLDLVGTRSNRDGIGAKVRWQAEGIVKNLQAKAGGSYLSTHDRRIHLGLGKVTSIDVIEVVWPSGVVQEIRDVRSDQFLTIREP